MHQFARKWDEYGTGTFSFSNFFSCSAKAIFLRCSWMYWPNFYSECSSYLLNSKYEHVVAVAASAVAAQLLCKSRTAHPTFQILILCNEALTCHFDISSADASKLTRPDLIIWDGVAMRMRNITEAGD